MTSPSHNTAQPWWKFGHVWLVVSGPLIVVIASFVTFYLAAHGKDPVIDENYYQAGLELNKAGVGKPESLAPAVQGRNHAATGLVLVPKEK
ncbi:FixH family protein [Rhodoferax sp.]|uniref:FixH family protein n=1 Tax=Rhodoferax sp. TaxID=50421 RepID=UPI0026002979|nr:FixH family protein [Rhodoferax sp.]